MTTIGAPLDVMLVTGNASWAGGQPHPAPARLLFAISSTAHCDCLDLDELLGPTERRNTQQCARRPIDPEDLRVLVPRDEQIIAR